MRRAHWLHLGLITASLSLGIGTTSHAQSSPTIALTSSVKLTSFTPIDSLFVNPTATTFNIALVHRVSGAPTEYRASRFSDFRDANWLPYNPEPHMTVTSNMFAATPGNSSSTQVMLYLQVRARNPKAGQPISVIGGKTQVQPDFFFSDPLARRVRIVFAG